MLTQIGSLCKQAAFGDLGGHTFLKDVLLKKKKEVTPKPERGLPGACHAGRSLNRAPHHFHPPDNS